MKRILITVCCLFCLVELNSSASALIIYPGDPLFPVAQQAQYPVVSWEGHHSVTDAFHGLDWQLGDRPYYLQIADGSTITRANFALVVYTPYPFLDCIIGEDLTFINCNFMGVFPHDSWHKENMTIGTHYGIYYLGTWLFDSDLEKWGYDATDNYFLYLSGK